MLTHDTQAMAASANPILADKEARDPTLFCTAYKRQRFYMFTRTEPEYLIGLFVEFFNVIDVAIVPETTNRKGTATCSMNVPHARSRLSHHHNLSKALLSHPWLIQPSFTPPKAICTFAFSQVRLRKP